MRPFTGFANCRALQPCLRQPGAKLRRATLRSSSTPTAVRMPLGNAWRIAAFARTGAGAGALPQVPPAPCN